MPDPILVLLTGAGFKVLNHAWWRISMQERVVVTGLGTINSLGHNTTQTWNNAINGVSGLA
jgi:hypothetical protein